MVEDDLDTLAQDFKDAASALHEAKKRIDGLASAERAVSDAGDSIRSLSSILDEFVGETREATEALIHTQESSSRLLTEAAGLLSGGDLAAIGDSLRGLREQLQSMQQVLEQRLQSNRDALESQLATDREAIETRVSAIEQSLEGLAKAAADKATVEAELAHIKANVAPRHLKKAQETFQAPGSA